MFLPDVAVLYCSAYDNEWHILDVKAPLKWDDEGRIYEHPTAYSDSAGEYIQSISYNRSVRQWTYNLNPNADTGVSLEIFSYPRGVPLWMGKPEGPYTIYGACEDKEDLVVWGGFFEVGYFSAQFSDGDTSHTFLGGFLWDRAYHRVYFNDSAAGTGAEDGIVPTYSYIGIQQEDVVLMLAQNEKPPGCTVTPPVPFLHQGRINFPLKDESYLFDDFSFVDVEYVDTLGLQPSKQHIEGTYDSGEVYLDGQVFKFWPPAWWRFPGTYWDSTTQFSWGRAYYVWNGHVTYGDDTIQVVNAFGGGEYTRHERDDIHVNHACRSSNRAGIVISTGHDPASGIIHLEYSLWRASPATVALYTASGNTVKSAAFSVQKAGTHRHQFDAKSLAQGMYIANVTTETGINTARIVVTR
ncbi:MAG: T9SS type A sorting domain-containing protein [Chitinivibrionales bacterium]|nr:T9SS type A sorting domain-containing protein [Chitinivibrionales bacterium]